MPDINREEYKQILITLLQKHEVFTDFTPQQIAEFADMADIQFYEQGAKIIEQGTQGSEFYVVLTGQLRVLDITQDPPRLLNYHSPGEIVGVRALLDDGVRAATVEVVLDAHLAVFGQKAWDWLTFENSRVVNYFRNMERKFDRRALADFPGRQWDEVVVASTKRHFLAFLVKLTFPLSLLIAPVLFLLGAELFGVRLLSAGIGNIILSILAIIPFVILSAALTIYYYVDWRNDDFIVTTKRVIHIERKLLYGKERHEAPLTRIQDVTLSAPSLIDRLDYHNLQIKTAGAGIIEINGIKQAGKMQAAIFQEGARARERIGAADLAAIRQRLAQQLNLAQTIEQNVMAIAEEQAVITPQEKTRHMSPLLDYFWPRVKEVTEQEAEGTTILWRKHYFVLLKAIILPVIAFLISLYVLIASFVAFLPFGVVALPFQMALGTLAVCSILWYIWRYDGWRRDIYLVTATRIVDVESSPFRLRGEQRRESTFNRIENITYDIPNFFSQLLNLGDVFIETAGTEGTFTFRQVFNPGAIQQEIFNRMVRFKQREYERERDATTSQLIGMIGEYHHLFEKAQSLDRQQESPDL